MGRYGPTRGPIHGVNPYLCPAQPAAATGMQASISVPARRADFTVRVPPTSGSLAHADRPSGPSFPWPESRSG